MISIWVALPERDHRLLHPRDRRLGTLAALPRRQNDRGRRAGSSHPHADEARRAACSAQTTAPPSLPAASELGSPRSGSSTARAATATPKARLHRELVRQYLKEREVWLNEYETLKDARTRDRRLRRPLPPPPALGAELPDTRKWPDLGGSTRTPKTSGLTCQLRRGARHPVTRFGSPR